MFFFFFQDRQNDFAQVTAFDHHAKVIQEVNNQTKGTIVVQAKHAGK